MAMKKEDQLMELIEAYAAFRREHPKGDLDAFCRHRLSRWDAQPSPPSEGDYPMEAHMGRSFGHLGRMVNLYSKKVLQPLGVSNLEDFGYLATLADMDKPRKGELIRMMHSETTSGTSIIKRLVERGWVQELRDPDDGRSTRVRVTPKGLRTLEKCFPAMASMTQMVFGLLEVPERVELLRLLKKIEEPHAEVLLEHRDYSFEELKDALYGEQ